MPAPPNSAKNEFLEILVELLSWANEKRQVQAAASAKNSFRINGFNLVRPEKERNCCAKVLLIQ